MVLKREGEREQGKEKKERCLECDISLFFLSTYTFDRPEMRALDGSEKELLEIIVKLIGICF